MGMRSDGAPRLVGLWIVTLCALLSACSQYSGAERAADEDYSPATATEGNSREADAPSHRAYGADAVWQVPDGAVLDPSTRSFAVEVSRVECNSGETGEVLEPTVREGARKVVVTFRVLSDDSDTDLKTCVGNEWVPSTVRLSEALGQRTLYDGECLPEATATAPGLCGAGGLRYPVVSR